MLREQAPVDVIGSMVRVDSATMHTTLLFYWRLAIGRIVELKFRDAGDYALFSALLICAGIRYTGATKFLRALAIDQSKDEMRH